MGCLSALVGSHRASACLACGLHTRVLSVAVLGFQERPARGCVLQDGKEALDKIMGYKKQPLEEAVTKLAGM